MGIPDEQLYEYALVRYVPRVDRDEFINIGLIMMSKRRRLLKGKIRLEEARLRAFNPKINIESLRNISRLYLCGTMSRRPTCLSRKSIVG